MAVGTRRGNDADWLLVVALVTATALRLVAVIGLHPYIYFDSGDYEVLDFSGDARRPWVTPLLYEMVGDDTRLRVLAQAVIGALSWVFLAVEVGALAGRESVRRIAVVVVLLLSLTTSVTNWDNTILSESLALSTSALLVGCLLRFARLQTMATAGIAVVAALLWSFTRQNHLVLGLLITTSSVVVTFVVWRRRRAFPAALAALAGGLVAVSVLAAVSYNQNPQIVHFNTAMVIGNRLLPDPDAVDWLHDHGMPDLPEGIPIGVVSNPEPLLDDEEFGEWVREDGVSTYTRFLLTHPWWTLTAPLEDLVSDRPSYADPPRIDETMLSTAEAYSTARNVVPEPIEEILFDPGQTGTVLVALIAALALTAQWWRTRGPDRRWLVPLLLILLEWPALTVVWHASAAELGRLSLISATILRLGIIAQLVLLADAWVRERREVSVDVGGE